MSNSAESTNASQGRNQQPSPQQNTRMRHREASDNARNVRSRVQSRNLETGSKCVRRRVCSRNLDTTSTTGSGPSTQIPSMLANQVLEAPSTTGSGPSTQSNHREVRSDTRNVRQRARRIRSLNPAPSIDSSNTLANQDVSPSYEDLGDCDQRCRHCGVAFWYGERVLRDSNNTTAEYHLCCGGGRIIMPQEPDPPQYIKDLLSDPHFMEHIRAYNQMFAMTSFGATVDRSVNAGPGPYVFKVSGQIYHWIGSLCPLDNKTPRFLQLYIHDTHKEV